MLLMQRIPLIALLLTLLALPAAAQQGEIVFEETDHDFGTIEEGTQATHTFTFRNEGNAAVRLTAVEASCGCTTPEWTREPVAPGETGTVTAVYDSEGRPGPFRRSIHIETDGKPAETTLYIRGDVAYPDIEDGVAQGQVVLDREQIDFGSVSPNRRVTAVVLLQNVGERPVRIVGAETPDKMVSAYFPDNPIFMDEVTEIRVAVRTYGLEPGQSFDYTVTLQTDDETRPEKTLQLSGRVAESGAD